MFDAYTIKKVLPRLVAAIILIQLSWFLFTTLITLVNQVAWGIEGVMYAPFGGINNFDLSAVLKPTTGGEGLFAGAIVAGAAVGGIALGAVGVLTLALSAFMFLAIGFFVLALRRAVLVALLVLSPIALVAWILPGTDKYWKLWWESFSKLLLMYPLILILIASGRIFAFITTNVSAANGGGVPTAVAQDLSKFLLVVVGYIGPFILIPKTFQLAGSAFGNLSGMVNNRSRGAFDRLKNYRQGKMGENAQKLKAGNRFADRNMLSRGFNRTTVGLGTGASGGFGFGERGRQAIDQTRRRAMIEQVMKNPKWQGMDQNDDALHAATYQSAKEAQAALTQRFGGDEARAERAVRAVQASIGFGRPQQIAAAQQLVSTGTGYNNLEDMTQTLARASGGDRNTASALAGFANAETKKVGRFDLAPSYGQLNGLVQGAIGTDGQTAPRQQAFHEASVRAARGQDAVTLLRGKPTEVENLAGSLQQHLAIQHARSQNMSLDAGARAQAQDEMLQTAAQIEQLNQSKGYASQEVQGHINNLMNQTEAIRTGGVGPGQAGPAVPGTVRANIDNDPAIERRWNQLNPKPRNPNDPNLPE